jgi:hypothetical protein
MNVIVWKNFRLVLMSGGAETPQKTHRKVQEASKSKT